MQYSRRPNTGLLLLGLLVLAGVATLAEASRKMGNKRRDKPGIPNMCGKDIDMKLACHCTTDDSRRNTVDADCLILHDEFPQSDVAWTSFRQHPLLRHVQLTVHRNGFMGYLPSAVLGAQRELRSITITFAEMREIPPFAFANLTRLENVTLPRNHIEVLDSHAFVNHPALRVLSLEENEIAVVDRLAFGNLPQLQELVLAKNNISELPDEVFVELDGLQQLHLNENMLKQLSRDMFRGLTSLQTLDLSYNDLRRVGDGVFAELWNLQVLSLSNNGMEHLSERAFEGINNLHTLSLRNNRLTLLESSVFGGLPELNWLDLSNNHLETLQFSTVQPMMEHLINNTVHQLKLDENKFICDCRLTWMFDVRNRTKNPDLRSTLDKVACRLQAPAQPGTGGADDPTATNAVHHFNPVYKSGGPQHYGEPNFGGGIHNQQQQQQQHKYQFGDGDVGGQVSVENDLTHHQQKPHHQHEHHLAGHHLVNLMQFGSAHLPCAVDLAEATELPQSRESIAGIDLRWLSGSSGQPAATAHSATKSLLLAASVAVAVMYAFGQ